MFLKIIIVGMVLVSVACGPAVDRDNQFVPIMPQLSADALSNIQNYSDVLRSENPEIEKLLSDPSLTAVTREFGPTVISVQHFPFRSEVAQSKIKPWSSWWFPKKEDSLFRDSNGRYSSALTKYDIVRKKFYEAAGRQGREPGSAANYERNQYNPNAVTWEGLCDAWSLASISKPEPKRPVTVKTRGFTVTFQVSELKALLLKTYEAVDDSGLKFYGQKFTGDVNGWIFPDIFPDQFHRFLEIQLFQKKQAFIMDHDPGPEVWNTPVFKANYLMDQIPNNPNAVFVRAWVYTAEPSQTSERDFVGTKETVREYDYVLLGTRTSNGSLTVTSGYWVKGPDGVDSRKDHPDFVIQIPNSEKLVRKSWNPEIDIELVDKILEKSY